MNRFIVTGLATACLLSAPGLANGQDTTELAVAPVDAEVSQTEPAAEETAAPDAPQVVENDPNEVICHTRRQTGSNFRERICMTRRQAEQAEEAAERSLARMRRGRAFSPN
ncbi:hypothetical protein [uncultured Maricaulis sp.]|uniref:hypothetical protein n=1 Tax=uncultured Maricaulis sp. TaxID=174710 RepID=UPI0030DB9FFA